MMTRHTRCDQNVERLFLLPTNGARQGHGRERAVILPCYVVRSISGPVSHAFLRQRAHVHLVFCSEPQP